MQEAAKKTFLETLRDAFEEQDSEKFLATLREIYRKLTDSVEIPQEVEGILRMQLDPSSEDFAGKGFLEDPHRWDFELPLEEGGEPHLMIYKDDGTIKVKLKGEDVPAGLERKFKKLGFS